MKVLGLSGGQEDTAQVPPKAGEDAKKIWRAAGPCLGPGKAWQCPAKPSKTWRSLAKAPVLSGGHQVSAQDLAKPSETPWALQREAGSLLGLCQGPVKALLLSEGQQGTAPSLRKVQGKSQDSREGRRALPQLWKNMEKDPGNAGEKQGSLQVSAPGIRGGRQGLGSTLEKGCAGAGVLVGLCAPSMADSSPSPSTEPRSKMETHHPGLPHRSGQD